MKFDLVKNRDGQAVIHWPGVIGMSSMVIAVYTAGWLALSLVLVLTIQWYSTASFIMLPWLLFCVVGLNTRHGLQKPAETLPTLA